ncbi:hypothetical protein [Ectothiorhodospira haloalkaliphila]|nr:hypothetical protein [Ectothiorhodospira haloalkaliphila]
MRPVPMLALLSTLPGLALADVPAVVLEEVTVTSATLRIPEQGCH